MEIDESLLRQRLKDVANAYVIKEKQKFLITQIPFANMINYKIGCDILLKSGEIDLYKYRNQIYNDPGLCFIKTQSGMLLSSDS